MVPRMLSLFAPLFLLLSSAFAQTHNFTFSGAPDSGGIVAVAKWDGTVIPNGNGTVQLRYNEAQYWGLSCPQQFGFPNDCFLLDNTFTPNFSAPIFKIPGCNLQTAGCADYETATDIVFTGYGQGVTMNVEMDFIVTKHIGRYGHVYYTNDPTGGSGSVTYTH